MSRPQHAADAAPWVFAILLASYGFFWHSRDWNTASRLMLTYSLVDRGTIRIDGLERQTGDRARFEGHSYTDKLPGFPLLATPAYAAAKVLRGLPDHPLGVPGLPHWEADYWTTLGTSGLATALLGALLVRWSRDLGCGSGSSALVGLAYGLATPAYTYATLAYGHQVSALALLAAFRWIWNAPGSNRVAGRLAMAGFASATAAVIELQVGPVAAVLGGYGVALALGGRIPASGVAAFGLGAVVPSLVLLGYNQLAYGSPWDMGYFHEVHSQFARVHSRANPLGLGGPDWSRLLPLLVGRRRGLLVFAPVLLLAAPGWFALVARRFAGVAIVSLAACVAVFLVNLSYPEWTGGWSTGPRLLVPLLPFAMLAVAGALASGGWAATAPAIALTLCGALAMLLYQGVGGRIPHAYPDPLLDPVWPLWRGDLLPSGWVNGERFSWTLVSWLAPERLDQWPESRRWVQFLPLVAFQLVAIGLTFRLCRSPDAPTRVRPRDP